MLKINKIKIWKYIAVIGLLVFLYALGLLSPIEGVLSKALNPVLKSVHSFSSNLRVGYNTQTSKINSAEKIKIQQAEINRLLAENASLKVQEEENELMRQFLDFFTDKDYNKVMAGVISRGDAQDIATRVELISIDKGSRDGLIPGLVVLNEQGIVVGKVSDVKESISSVQLVLNDDCRMAATILGGSQTSGIVEGDLGLTMKMNYIPQSKEIKVQDIVISSGLEETIPRGLVIGQVTEMLEESNDLWKSAVLESSVYFEELTIVSVILP